MDGQYLEINKDEYVKYSKIWLKYAIKGKSWERADDVHIDEISTDFKNSDTWLDASLFLLNCFYDIIDTSLYYVLLVIPLIETKKNRDWHKLTLINIKDNLHDMTPPSFYLIPKDSIGKYIDKSNLIKLEINYNDYDMLFCELPDGKLFCSFIYVIKNI